MHLLYLITTFFIYLLGVLLIGRNHNWQEHARPGIDLSKSWVLLFSVGLFFQFRIAFLTFLNWEFLLWEGNWEFTYEAVWPWLLFVGRFFISVLVIGLFIFSVSFWFSFERLHLSKNLSISSKLSILLTYSFSEFSLMSLCISVLSVVTFF